MFVTAATVVEYEWHLVRKATTADMAEGWAAWVGAAKQSQAWRLIH